jgi:type II secretion system protein G
MISRWERARVSMRAGAAWGFTLVELLIVVAIIGVLAAIAVPNFMQASVRSRYARTLNEMRTIHTGLDAYVVDNNRYPPTRGTFAPSYIERLKGLTTPIAYLSSIPRDPFPRTVLTQWNGQINLADPDDIFGYNTGAANYALGINDPSSLINMRWSLTSGGPDGGIHWPYYAFDARFVEDGSYINWSYDPTNGTVSAGDIFRRGGERARE